MNRRPIHKSLSSAAVALAVRAAGVCGLLVLVTLSVGWIGARSRSRTLTAPRTTICRISGR